MRLKATIFEPVERRRPAKVISPAAAPIPQSVFKRLKCLIIVPAFNESRSVAKLVRRLNQSLPDCHVLVIDDGSTDDTVRQIPADGIGGESAVQSGDRRSDADGVSICGTTWV